MSNVNSSKEQLIIELAKLRNKVYVLEDEHSEKDRLEKEIAILQKKLLHKERTQSQLNNMLKDVLLVDIDKVNELLDEFEVTNNSSLITNATDTIYESVRKLKGANGD